MFRPQYVLHQAAPACNGRLGEGSNSGHEMPDRMARADGSRHGRAIPGNQLLSADLCVRPITIPPAEAGTEAPRPSW